MNAIGYGRLELIRGRIKENACIGKLLITAGSCKKAAKHLLKKKPVKKALGCALLAALLGLFLLIWNLAATVNRLDTLVLFYQVENRELRIALDDLLAAGERVEVILEFIDEARGIDTGEFTREMDRLEEENPNVPPPDIPMERYLILLQGVLEVVSEDIEKDRERLAGYRDRIQATPNLRPADGPVVSGFGYRQSPFASALLSRHGGGAVTYHSGVDIAGPEGSRIYATADGTVSFAAIRGSWGNLVIIDHGYGYQTYYAHLSGFAVSIGEKVRRGQVIGYMGGTGRVTGTHLHYEVRINGQPVDPARYF